MEINLRYYVIYKQQIWARLLLMTMFPWNNVRNTSTEFTPFELSCGYHLQVSYKEDIDPHSKFKSANKLAMELWKLTVIYQKNIEHAQKLLIKTYKERTKLKSYALGRKVWLNIKYMKIKRNKKLESKFFRWFTVFYPVGTQAYKLKSLKQWRIYNVFYVLLLKHDLTKRG